MSSLPRLDSHSNPHSYWDGFGRGRIESSSRLIDNHKARVGLCQTGEDTGCGFDTWRFMDAGAGRDFCLDPTVPERKLYSQASQNSAEIAVGSAHFGQLFCTAMGFAANNLSATNLWIRGLPTVDDLKNAPMGRFARQTAKTIRVTANANKNEISALEFIMTIFPSVITVSLGRVSIAWNYITIHCSESNFNADRRYL